MHSRKKRFLIWFINCRDLFFVLVMTIYRQTKLVNFYQRTVFVHKSMDE
jgi:hypothetical protein